MRKLSLMRDIIRLIFILSSLATLTGCYASSKFIKVPDASDSIIRTMDNTSISKLPAFVSSINVKLNNGSRNPSADFERRLLGHINQSNYFSDVINGTLSRRPEPPYIELSLDTDAHEDMNTGSNMFKAVLTGLTLFLLAPALPATFDFDVNYALHAKWPNGIQKVYKASCTASASGTYPFVKLNNEFAAAKGNCSEKCLNSVINQLTSDRSQ